MDKSSRMVKRVPAVGTESDGEEFGSPVPVVFRRGDGGARCSAFLEIADTPSRRRRGLSKRACLGRMSGMFFDCAGPFWMKDVEFPLDLVFTDESGRITEKTAMAVDKEGSRRYYPGDPESRNAVELPLGFCERHGIGAGDTIEPVSLSGRD